MAYTKVFAIHDRLDKRVEYAVNPDKTEGQPERLNAGIQYAVNPAKTETEEVCYTDVLNCTGVENAFAEMQRTKERFGQDGGVVGYHFIQSFKPGEVTPEQAHAIGMEFAQRMFGDRYEVVIGTHLDKAHLHNHIVINSVSFVDGRKYHSNAKSYYVDVRGTSDELCRENDLSVIVPEGKGKHYAEWAAEHGRRPTVREPLRQDIDEIIGQSFNMETFFMLLERKGYQVRRRGGRYKYTSVLPPGGKRAIRLASLGPNYTDDAIRERIQRRRDSGLGYIKSEPRRQRHKRRYRLRGKAAALWQTRQIRGFQALYWRYLTLLRAVRRRRTTRRVSNTVRHELAKLERYTRQFNYLQEQHISTAAELQVRIGTLEEALETVVQQRKPLYQEKKGAQSNEEKQALSAEIQHYTAVARETRRELRLCRAIEQEIPAMAAITREVQRQEQQQDEQQKNKEEQNKNEYRRR